MKLTTEITEAERSELQASMDHLAKLRKKFAGLEKRQADLEETKTKATARLAAAEKIALEKACEEAGEEAAAKVLAIRHQLGQIELTFRRWELELEELEKEAATALFFAAKEIRAAHRPLMENLITEVEHFLAPYYFAQRHARETAGGLPAIEQARHFANHPIQPRVFRTSEELLSALGSVGETLKAFLAGEAVVTIATDAKDGALSFPAYV